MMLSPYDGDRSHSPLLRLRAQAHCAIIGGMIARMPVHIHAWIQPSPALGASRGEGPGA